MRIAAGVLAIGLFAATASHASVLYTETFNDFVGGYSPATQYGTGLTVNAAGTVGGYTAYGFNALHAVDRSGFGDWAVMLYGDVGGGQSGTNGLRTSTEIAGVNLAGQTYNLAYELAGAVYNNVSQATKAGDYFVVQAMDANGNMLAQKSSGMEFTTSNPFGTDGFSYIGSGVGGVTLNIFAITAPGDFAGAIDNLTISGVAVPEPASMALLGMGLVAVGAVRRRKQAAI